MTLWAKVKDAGQPFGIGPGTPNPTERVESGLLSWGGDTDDETNPYEVRMGKYVDLDCPDDTIGIKALRRLQERGPKRHQIGVVMDIEGRVSYADGRPRVHKGATDAGLRHGANVVTAAEEQYRDRVGLDRGRSG